VRAIGGFLIWLMDAQTGWARPFGEFNHRWISAMFRPVGPVKDFLNGRWLRHPLHAALTDGPIGILFTVTVLDVLGQSAAADVTLVLGVLAVVAAGVAGLADFADTDGAARTRATLHGTLMVLALLIYLSSMVTRLGEPADRLIPIATAIAGFLVLAAGAFVGGDIVYALGNMVSRHAFGRGGATWVVLNLPPDGELAESIVVRATAGTQQLALVRVGDTVHGLHDACAHAGGQLSRGKLVDGCLECPLHGSRFRVTDGAAMRGPTVYDQPTYAVRRTGGGGWEARRVS
jgi:nitrite reductase/ring-hydroxylating ferredoxin subunit